MAKKRKGGNSEKLCDAIVKGMLEKKAADILVMDLRKVGLMSSENVRFLPGSLIHVLPR